MASSSSYTASDAERDLWLLLTSRTLQKRQYRGHGVAKQTVKADQLRLDQLDSRLVGLSAKGCVASQWYTRILEVQLPLAGRLEQDWRLSASQAGGFSYACASAEHVKAPADSQALYENNELAHFKLGGAARKTLLAILQNTRGFSSDVSIPRYL